MQADPELIELQAEKERLTKRLAELQIQLHQASKNNQNKSIDFIESPDDWDDLITPVNDDDDDENTDEKFVVKLVETTQRATGIYYSNISKNWLKDDVWIYRANVLIKVSDFKLFDFKLDLTVDVQDKKNTKILDITCHFENVRACYLQEVIPWVTKFTTTKQFSPLMSAFSDYGDVAKSREKILNKVAKKKFATVEESDKPGFIAFIHSPNSITKPLAKIDWQIVFNDKTRALDHNFAIDVIEKDFGDQHQELFQNLCKKGLKLADLQRLWEDLCTSITEYN